MRLLAAALGLCIGCSAGSPSSPSPADASNPDDSSHFDASRVDASRSDVTHASPPSVCNGHAELCSRAYDHVTFPGTHGSYADTSEGFLAPDQTYPVARQLADGIRVLHFELHLYGDGTEVYACHSICQVGSSPFAHEMASIASFVKGHPTEVVTMLLERSDDVITADDIGDVIKAAGVEPLMRVQGVGAAWPTLGEMIESGQRLVALLDDTTGSHDPWLLPRWDLTWETPWDNTTPADFTQCFASRGMMGDGVYVVDTYLEDQDVETVAHAKLVNTDPFLIERLLYCQRATSTLPNFAMVNFYEVSDVFSAVDVLNGFAPEPADVDLSTFPPTWPYDAGVDATDATPDARRD